MGLKPGQHLPYALERALTQQIAFSVWSGAARVVPTSATITIWDSSGRVETSSQVISEAVDTIGSDGILTHTITSAELPATLGLSTDWLTEWALTIAGSVSTFRVRTYLVRRRYFPLVTHGDVVKTHHELAAAESLPEGKTSWEDAIDEADDLMQLRLNRLGRRPHLIIEHEQLYAPLLYWSRAHAFRDIRRDGTGKFAELVGDYMDKAEAAFTALAFEYDSTEDGQADEVLAASGVLNLTAGRIRGRRWAWR